MNISFLLQKIKCLFLPLLFLSTIIIVGCNNDSNPFPNQDGGGNNQPSLVSLQIHPLDASQGSSKIQLPIDEYLEYEAIATYSDDSTLIVTDQVKWQSSQPNTVEIGSLGIVHGIKLGEANITASLTGITSNVAAITVIDTYITNLQIIPIQVTIPKGTDQHYTAIATYSDKTQKIVSNNVVWNSSNNAKATIDSNGNANALQQGETTIQATISTPKGTITSNRGTLSISNAELVDIKITPPLKNIAKGITQQYTAIGTYSDNSTQDISSKVAWSSSNNNLVTISNLGLVHANEAGIVTIKAIMNEKTSNLALLSIADAKITSIQVTPTRNKIAKGTTIQYNAIATYSDDTTHDITASVNWNSSNSNIATINRTGLVTSSAEGSIIIKATKNGIVSNRASLTVSNETLVSIQVTPPYKSIAKGTTQQYRATGTYSDGSIQDISSQVAWLSSGSGVVAISNQGLATGVVEGNVVIEPYLDGVSYSNEANLKITDGILERIQIIPFNSKIAKGTNQQYIAIGIYSDNTTQDITNDVSWNSNDSSIATIDKNGLAMGIKAGNVQIKASKLSNGTPINSNVATLTISNAVITQLQVTPTKNSIANGTSIQYVAHATFSDSTVQEVSHLVSWRASDPDKVTISSSGKVYAENVGFSNINAYLDTKLSNTATLTITDPILENIQVIPAKLSLAKGVDKQYVAIGNYSDGSTQDITQDVIWTSSRLDIATITSTDIRGIATAVTPGTTIIQARLGSISSSEAELQVNAATVSSIEVSPLTQTVEVGRQVQYYATAYYDDDSTQDISLISSWISSDLNAKNATLSFRGEATGVSPTTVGNEVTINAYFNGLYNTEPVTLTVSAAKLESIQITPLFSTIAQNTYIQYKAIGLYSDRSIKDITTAVAWISSDNNIATIGNSPDNKGKAVGVRPGISNISATLDEISSGTAALTVSNAAIEQLHITPSILMLPIGSSAQLFADATFSDGSVQDVSQLVSWRNNSVDKITISNIGKVTAVDKVSGEPITAYLDGMLSSPTYVNVTDAQLKGLKLSPSTAELAKGDTLQYKVTGVYSDDSEIEENEGLKWSSSNSGYAPVNASGLVSANIVGSTIIKVKKVNNSAVTITSNEASLQVIEPAAQLTNIAITPLTAEIAFDNTFQLKAIATFDDGTTQDVTKKVTWTSDHLDRVTFINNSGLAMGIAFGPANISAELNGVTSTESAVLTVTGASLKSIRIYHDPAIVEAAITTNSSRQLFAEGLYSNGSTRDLTKEVLWSKNNANLDISNNTSEYPGIVTAITTGSTTITASKNGIVSNDYTTTIRDPNNYRCATPTITIDGKTFTCPLNVLDFDNPSEYIDTYQLTGRSGPNGMIVARLNHDQAANVCGKSARLPTAAELSNLWNKLYSTDPSNGGGLYLIYGWPTAVVYRTDVKEVTFHADHGNVGGDEPLALVSCVNK